MSLEYSGLELDIFPEVYEPAEDSFLLAKYAKWLGGRILEIGCGSGIVSLVCAQTEGNSVLGVDLNPKAVENSRLNAKKNGIANAEFAEGGLFSAVPGKKFDAIVFNPPYLPTSGEEKVRGKLNLAFDGGKTGRKVTDRFISQFPEFLKEKGTLLMIESSLSGIEKTVKKLEKLGFRAEILEEEKFFFEKIAVIQARKI